MKMRFWDNDFDRMFDEAVEELEKNQEIMKKCLTNNQKYAIIITVRKREVIKMEMIIYVNGYPMGGAISGCEFIGEAWVKAQELAEMLDVSCALVSAETGEVIAWWEP